MRRGVQKISRRSMARSVERDVGVQHSELLCFLQRKCIVWIFRVSRYGHQKRLGEDGGRHKNPRMVGNYGPNAGSSSLQKTRRVVGRNGRSISSRLKRLANDHLESASTTVGQVLPGP